MYNNQMDFKKYPRRSTTLLLLLVVAFVCFSIIANTFGMAAQSKGATDGGAPFLVAFFLLGPILLICVIAGLLIYSSMHKKSTPNAMAVPMVNKQTVHDSSAVTTTASNPNQLPQVNPEVPEQVNRQ
ncbi:hypothetical protein IPL68_05295 [Candidatus Saccharibacteria bacterium]|nr:MAG: hypothetical protein IPL68_05295 [Candidatus Saccharibacteria bacterium]